MLSGLWQTETTVQALRPQAADDANATKSQQKAPRRERRG